MDPIISKFRSSKDSLVSEPPQETEEYSLPFSNTDGPSINYSELKDASAILPIKSLSKTKRRKWKKQNEANEYGKISLKPKFEFKRTPTSPPILPDRNSQSNLKTCSSSDDIFKTPEKNVTHNLNYTSTLPNINLKLTRSASTQQESSLPNLSFIRSTSSIFETGPVPPIPPKPKAYNKFLSLPNRGKGQQHKEGLSTEFKKITISNKTSSGTENSIVKSLSQLLYHSKLPVVVKIVRGYCVDEVDDEPMDKQAITEGDILVIVNLFVKDCVIINLLEENINISIPVDAKCKYLLLPDSEKLEHSKVLKFSDILHLKDTPDRLRVVKSFHNYQTGIINIGTIISVIKCEKQNRYISVALFEGTKFFLTEECIGEFSPYLNHQPLVMKDILNICKHQQRVLIKGDLNKGFVKQYTNNKKGIIQEFIKEDYLYCNEMIQGEGSLKQGRSWYLPIDDEIWIELVDEIKVIDHNYDVLSPEGEYDQLDSGFVAKDPKQRFYEKELSNLKIQKRRLEYKVSKLEKELMLARERDNTMKSDKVGFSSLSNETYKSCDIGVYDVPCSIYDVPSKIARPCNPKDLRPITNVTFDQVAIMNVTEISQLLERLNLSAYCKHFEKEQINGDLFLLLEEDDLADLNILKKLDKKKIIRVKELLRSGQSILNYLYY